MAKYKGRGRHPEKVVSLRPRDRQLFQFLDSLDGLASFRQIHEEIFPEVDQTQVSRRLWQLYDNRYLNRPHPEDMHQVPELVYWLDKRGYRELAALSGDVPSRATLKRASYPNSFQKVRHHLAVNDCHLAVGRAVASLDGYRLVRSITDLQFSRMKAQQVEYRTMSGQKQKKAVGPDWFCLIRRPSLTIPGKDDLYGFLWEVDLKTHPHDRFADNKVRAAVAYLKSPLFKQQTGVHYGRWLVVTNGQERMHYLRETTLAAGGEKSFFFTTLATIRQAPRQVLTSPIWLAADSDEAVSIMPTG